MGDPSPSALARFEQHDGFFFVMVIKVKRRENPFVQIDRNILEDPTLSWKAKGILCYLLSKPKDWTVRTEDLANKGSCGRETILSGMRELREAGYAKIVYVQGEKGKLQGRYWLILEEPEEDDGEGEIVQQDEENQHRDPHSPVSGKTRSSAKPTDTNIICSSNKDPLRGTDWGFRTDPSTPFDLSARKLTKSFLNFYHSKRLHIGRQEPSISKWDNAFSELIDCINNDGEVPLGDAISKIESTLFWYFANFRDPYLPTCYSAITFCEKYLQIEKARQRKEGEPSNREQGPVIRTGEVTVGDHSKLREDE